VIAVAGAQAIATTSGGIAWSLGRCDGQRLTPAARLDDVLARSSAYAETGADSLFVPGLADMQVIAELAEASPLPVNVMAGPGRRSSRS
jgi:2-methylisocitrate lyase-like PEP mutase family enzyme